MDLILRNRNPNASQFNHDPAAYIFLLVEAPSLPPHTSRSRHHLGYLLLLDLQRNQVSYVDPNTDRIQSFLEVGG